MLLLVRNIEGSQLVLEHDCRVVVEGRGVDEGCTGTVVDIDCGTRGGDEGIKGEGEFDGGVKEGGGVGGGNGTVISKISTTFEEPKLL